MATIDLNSLAADAAPQSSTVENYLLDGQEKYRFIEIGPLPTDALKIFAYRLNSLASLYYFTKVILRRRRLTDSLHKPICDALQTTRLKKLIELPRDHFKSTVGSEAFPIWRALPFGPAEEDALTKLGYSTEYIEYMRRLHKRDIRTLLVSEVVTNAKKLGRRINFHYMYNDFFREVYKDIIPDTSCKWTEESMTHKRSNASPNGEGTYDFIGVGGALQSRHYDLIDEDDLIGKKAADSAIVMEYSINYHQLLSGAWDSDTYNVDSIGDELIIGNRWAPEDLNMWVRTNEPDFTVISHDALGGCCAAHPEGVPIFPEEFSLTKLRAMEQKLGPYLFSCQFRNRPVNPETRVFKDEWLRYYTFAPMGSGDKRIKIVHEVEGGIVTADVLPRELLRTMVIDPNHSGEAGRCKHAITVMGCHERTGMKYLLDVWAKSCNYEEFIDQIYIMGDRWKLDKFWLETVAAQKYLKYHLEQLRNKRFMLIKELKTPRALGAKKDRIEALVPLFFRREVWVRKEQREFLGEYETYPNCRTLDVLDTLGYQPQTWGEGSVKNEKLMALAAAQRAKLSKLGSAGYGAAVMM